MSSGNLDTAVASFPAGSRESVADAAREGFLAGMNEILMLGGILAFAGAVAALWLVREADIERGEGPRPRRVEGEAVPEPVAGVAPPTCRLGGGAGRGAGRLLRVCGLQSGDTGAIDSSVNGGDRMAAACGHPPSQPAPDKEGEAFP